MNRISVYYRYIISFLTFQFSISFYSVHVNCINILLLLIQYDSLCLIFGIYPIYINVIDMVEFKSVIMLFVFDLFFPPTFLVFLRIEYFFMIQFHLCYWLISYSFLGRRWLLYTYQNTSLICHSLPSNHITIIPLLSGLSQRSWLMLMLIWINSFLLEKFI